MSDDTSTIEERRGYVDRLPVVRSMAYDQRKKTVEYIQHLLLLGSLMVIVFPLFWMFSSSLRPDAFLQTRPTPYLPRPFSLEQFQRILFESNFPRWYLNSIIYSMGVVFLTTSTATLGGYGLTRLDIPKKRSFARVILFGYMFPAILLAIPMFIFWRELGVINSYAGLILAMTASALPFSLWLMWKFFQTVPISLEESARMAGATRFRAFYEIALPVAKPGIIAVAVFAYASSWDQYTIPLILAPDASMWPLTVGIESFIRHTEISWGPIMAMSSLAVVPAFVFVYFLQRYLLRGFSAGGE